MDAEDKITAEQADVAKSFEEMGDKEKTYQRLRSAVRDRWERFEAAKASEEDLRARIRDAITAGHSVSDIARWTDLSPARIYQIRDNRR